MPKLASAQPFPVAFNFIRGTLMNSPCSRLDGAVAPASQAQAQLCLMRVLVVEDDKKIASFILKGLKQNGFAVDDAANGEDGLDLAASAPYDAAVIDIMLPKRD